MTKNILDIGEVIKRTGFSASALRYYEQIGLIKSVGRHGLRRLFTTSVLEQLSLISLGQLAGLSLKEIANMFTTNGDLQIDRQQLLVKADEMDQKIKQLSAMRDGLRHAAVCPEPNHLSCPKFNKMLKVANKKVRRLAKE